MIYNINNKLENISNIIRENLNASVVVLFYVFKELKFCFSNKVDC